MVVSRTSIKVGITTARAITQGLGLASRLALGVWKAAALIEGSAEAPEAFQPARLEGTFPHQDQWVSRTHARVG